MTKKPPVDTQAAKVVRHVRQLVQKRVLKPGDKMPPERELACKLEISRASLRAGIGQLAAMGVVLVKHGVGTFIASRPSAITAASFDLISSVHGFSPHQLYEARLVLEGCLAAMAAQNRCDEHLAALAEEVADMYATLGSPSEYLLHDIRFHRVIAQAAGNPILALVMETVAASFYDTRRQADAPSVDLKEAADMHRKIYRAIRVGDVAEARLAMESHLKTAATKVSQKRTAEQKKKQVKESTH